MDFGIAAASYALFLFSTVCHEAAHALAAKLGGDDTADRGGQVSLDPIPHMRREPFGMVVVPLLGLFTGGLLIGWASTPFDPRWAAAYPKRAAAMALAGPLANLGLVIWASLVIKTGIAAGYLLRSPSIGFSSVVTGQGPAWASGLAIMVSILFSLNLLLFFFNLLPLAPLDGASALGLIPGGERLSATLRAPQFRFLGLLAAWYVFPHIYGPIQVVCLNLLFPGAHYH